MIKLDKENLKKIAPNITLNCCKCGEPPDIYIGPMRIIMASHCGMSGRLGWGEESWNKIQSRYLAIAIFLKGYSTINSIDNIEPL